MEGENDKREVTIKAGHVNQTYLQDMWRFRELLYILSWRDFSVRYKQTVVGVLWALLRPLIVLLIFTLVFGGIAGLQEQESVPYILIVVGGVLPWQFLSGGISESAASLIGNERLITKVYFPRMLIPVSTLLTILVDFIISLSLTFILFYVLAFPLQVRALAIFFWLPWAMVLALGIGIWLSALNVRYRDFRYLLPFLLQGGLFLSPVGFATHQVPDQWMWLYQLNPVVGLIDGFRWCLGVGEGAFPLFSASYSFCFGVVGMVSGFFYFRHTERNFADWI